MCVPLRPLMTVTCVLSLVQNKKWLTPPASATVSKELEDALLGPDELARPNELISQPEQSQRGKQKDPLLFSKNWNLCRDGCQNLLRIFTPYLRNLLFSPEMWCPTPGRGYISLE